MRDDSKIELPEIHSCAFCAYLRGDRPFTIVNRAEHTATLVTREQRGHPHLLVLPVRHAPTILELTDGELSAIAVQLKKVAAMIERAYQRKGIAIWQNNGVPAGQTISHFHFHVAGTLDGGGTEFGEVPEISIAETDAIAKRLLDCG